MNFTIPKSNLILENIDSFITELSSGDLNITIDLEVSVSKTSPKFHVWFNENLIFDESVVEGKKEISFTVTNIKQSNKLVMKMSNKLDNETIMENGEIIKDTFIAIKDLKINNFSLITDLDFFYNNLKYYVENNEEYPKVGFWINNSELVLEFENPFILWYNEKTNKNVVSAAPLAHKSKTYEFRNFSEEAKLEIIESLKKLKF